MLSPAALQLQWPLGLLRKTSHNDALLVCALCTLEGDHMCFIDTASSRPLLDIESPACSNRSSGLSEQLVKSSTINFLQAGRTCRLSLSSFTRTSAYCHCHCILSSITAIHSLLRLVPSIAKTATLQSLRSNMVSPVVIIIHYVTFKAELSPVVSP